MVRKEQKENAKIMALENHTQHCNGFCFYDKTVLLTLFHTRSLSTSLKLKQTTYIV